MRDLYSAVEFDPEAEEAAAAHLPPRAALPPGAGGPPLRATLDCLLSYTSLLLLERGPGDSAVGSSPGSSDGSSSSRSAARARTAAARPTHRRSGC